MNLRDYSSSLSCFIPYYRWARTNRLLCASPPHPHPTAIFHTSQPVSRNFPLPFSKPAAFQLVRLPLATSHGPTVRGNDDYFWFVCFRLTPPRGRGGQPLSQERCCKRVREQPAFLFEFRAAVVMTSKAKVRNSPDSSPIARRCVNEIIRRNELNEYTTIIRCIQYYRSEQLFAICSSLFTIGASNHFERLPTMQSNPFHGTCKSAVSQNLNFWKSCTQSLQPSRL